MTALGQDVKITVKPARKAIGGWKWWWGELWARFALPTLRLLFEYPLLLFFHRYNEFSPY